MNVVYELRQRAGLTQELLARQVGVDRSMISRFETGRASPRLDTLQRLAAAVGHEIVVSIRPLSPPQPVERVDPGASAALPAVRAPTSSAQDTENAGGVAVFASCSGAEG